MPAPGIVRKGNDWYCVNCGGVNTCECADVEFPDPICDCGWPGYACHCMEEGEPEESLKLEIPFTKSNPFPYPENDEELRKERDAAMALLGTRNRIEWGGSPDRSGYGYYLDKEWAGPTMLDVVRLQAGLSHGI